MRAKQSLVLGGLQSLEERGGHSGSSAVDPVSKGFAAQPEVWTWTDRLLSVPPPVPLRNSPEQVTCPL